MGGRLLGEDDRRRRTGERDAEGGAPAPVAEQQRTWCVDAVREPEREQAEARERVDAVVDVAVDREQVGEDERNREGERERSGEPASLLLGPRRRGVQSRNSSGSDGGHRGPPFETRMRPHTPRRIGAAAERPQGFSAPGSALSPMRLPLHQAEIEREIERLTSR
jgi:hypothetical protein